MTRAESARRQQIIDAAVQLVTERGSADAVSVDAIAARAGTTKATLYRYFPTKAGLVAEVVANGVPIGEPARPREHILDAALRVVTRRGLHGTTMEQVAAEAGVSPAALYWHFGSRDALVLALFQRLPDLLHVSAIVAQADGDPEVVVRGLSSRGMAVQSEQIGLLATLLSEVADQPELASALYDGIIGPLWGSLADYLGGEAERGRLRAGHPLLRVLAFVGMLAFYNLARRAFGPRLELPPPAEAAEEFASIFLRGIIDSKRGGTP